MQSTWHRVGSSSGLRPQDTWVRILKGAGEGLRTEQGRWESWKLSWPKRFPCSPSWTSPGGGVSGCQEPEEKNPLPLEIVTERERGRKRNTIIIAIGNQVPDVVKAQHLNWGLEAELYQRTASVVSLRAGKFSMQMQWPFVKWPRVWLGPKEHPGLPDSAVTSPPVLSLPSTTGLCSAFSTHLHSLSWETEKGNRLTTHTLYSVSLDGAQAMIMRSSQFICVSI